jgi:uncharacterized protein (DUF1501 family)
MAHTPCNDFRRGELLRAAAAEAGRGLPAIEAGMPLPAGTGMDRRSFMLRSAGLGLSVFAAGRLAGIDALEAGVAMAQERGPAPVIVSVFLDGGIDGLSVLAPVRDPLYRVQRPRLALAEGAGTRFGEDPRLMWHPAASGLATLHGEGKLTVLPAIGYSDADQSHFTSRHYWEVGATSASERTGWLGRWLDRVGSFDNPVQGLSLDGRLSPVLASARVPVAAIGGNDYTLGARGVWGEIAQQMQRAVYELGSAHASEADPALRHAGIAAGNVARLTDQLAAFEIDPKNPPVPPVPYPNDAKTGFPLQLASLAWLLAGGLPMRAVSVRGPGGHDTHERQPDELQKNLQLTSDTLVACQRDLQARGLADRVITLVWSEFGRRVQENASLGTDHGAAGIGFVMGSRVAGRMIGEFPGLGKLDPQGNLRATADYRALYASILEQWLGTDAASVIPGAAKFARPWVIR